jgi:hypothetical protein
MKSPSTSAAAIPELPCASWTRSTKQLPLWLTYQPLAPFTNPTILVCAMYVSEPLSDLRIT